MILLGEPFITREQLLRFVCREAPMQSEKVDAAGLRGERRQPLVQRLRRYRRLPTFNAPGGRATPADLLRNPRIFS